MYRIEEDTQGRCYIARKPESKNQECWDRVALIYKTRVVGEYFDDWQETAQRIVDFLNAQEQPA